MQMHLGRDHPIPSFVETSKGILEIQNLIIWNRNPFQDETWKASIASPGTQQALIQEPQVPSLEGTQNSINRTSL